MNRNLFIGVFPAGISYCDTSREEHGDYKKVAFLSFRSLSLEIYSPSSKLLDDIRSHAESIIAKRGESFTVSTCGQTVRLGS